MKPNLYWQNPFVDVFKHFKVFDLKNTEKKGRVTVAQDKDVARKILKIEGQVSTSNNITIPGQVSEISSLSLIGNYKQGDKELQVNFTEVPNKWGIVCIDSKSFLQELNPSVNDVNVDYSIKSIQLCANAKYKNLFTSSNLYNCENMPKDMYMILPKNESFFDRYQWILVTHSISSKENNKNVNNIKPLEANKDEKEKFIPTKQSKENLKSILKKKVQIQDPSQNNEVEEEQVDFEFSDNEEEEQQEEIIKTQNPRGLKSSLKKKNKIDDGYDQNKKELDNIQEQEKESIPVVYENTFSLQPTPIMRLSHIHGYSGGKRNICSFGNGSILYSSGSVLIMQDVKSREQKYMFGQNSEILQIVASFKERLIITTDNTQISFWDAHTLQRTGFYYTGYQQILAIDIAYHKKELYVALAGLDNLKRPGIMIIKGDQVIVKHLSNFDIVKLAFIDKRDIFKGLISVGKENIRFWWIKGKGSETILAQHSAYLGEHARDNIFWDFAIAQTDTKQYKILVVGNTGNLYILDTIEKEMIGVFMIHEEPIKCIGLHNDIEDISKQYVITCGNNGKIKVWKLDFSEMILEAKLDSQVCSLSINDYIICGCLNGTIGALSIEKKKFTIIIRSHSDKILDLKYHKGARKVITISEDFSIRIWDLMKLKGTNNIFFQQVYEFRCLDEQVTCVQPYNNRDKFICGFESGSVRVFDIRNYSVACELELHKTRILKVDVSRFDKYGLSADAQKVALFNEQFQCVKEIEIKNLLNVGFDIVGDFFYIMSDPYCLKIYGMNNFELKQALNSLEEIKGVRFTTRKEELVIFTQKYKIKKYKIHPDEIKLFREYSNIHKGQINNITISQNAQYIFTTGEDQLLKIWDYHFRGGMNPAFQAYNCGEPIESIITSDDELNLVFAYGGNSKSLYCWKFQGELIKETADRPLEDEVQSNLQTNEPEEKIIFSNLSVRREGNNYIEECKNTKEDETLLSKPIRGLYDEIQQKYNIGDAFDLKEIQKVPIFNTAQNYDYDMNLNLNDNGRQERLFEERRPGQYLDINYVIGFNTKGGIPQEKFIWNQKNRYLVTFVNNFLVISHLQSPCRDQKVIQLEHHISKIEISPNCRYYIATLQNKASSIKVYDSNSHAQIKELYHPQECTLLNIQISPCSNYLLSVIQLLASTDQNETNKQNNNIKHGATLLNIWELASGRLVSSSSTDENCQFVTTRWNNVTLGALEFAVVYKNGLQFWRLNSRMTLEYQQADLNNKNTGNLVSLNYIQIQQNQKHLALIGTSTGSVIVFDVRSGSMLCMCQGVINQGISEILVQKNNLILLSNTVNVYRFDLGDLNTIDIQKFATSISQTTMVYTLDSYPISYSSMGDDEIRQGLDQPIAQLSIMLLSKCGLMWLIDFEDNATLRISSTHQSDKLIKSCRYIPRIGDNGLIISSSNDSTIKVWELDSIEEKTEFYAPKKECLCMDVISELNILACGYSDGFIRFYNYETYENYGASYIHDQAQQQNKIRDNQPQNISINSLKALPKTRNIITANSLGDIYVLYIEKLKPFLIQINKIADNIGFAADFLDISVFDPLSLFLATTQDSKIQVWSRKCLKRKQNPVEEMMKIYELEYYLIDNYKLQSYKNKQLNQAQFCQALFSKQEKDEFLVISPLIDFIQIRNFREHINVRQIALVSLPKKIALNEKGDIIFIGHQDGYLSLYDAHNGIELDRRRIGEKQEITDLYVFDEQVKIRKENTMVEQDQQINSAPFVLVSSNNQITVFNLFQAPVGDNSAL